MITRRSSPLPVAVVVALGGVLLAAALNAGAAARAASLPSGPAVILTVGDRSKPSELIHLLRDLASYDPLTAARYVAEADAAYRRGDAPNVRIPVPSTEAAKAITQAVARPCYRHHRSHRDSSAKRGHAVPIPLDQLVFGACLLGLGGIGWLIAALLRKWRRPPDI